MIFPTANIDYTARDYQSLRDQLLNRLAITLPDFEERNPADVEIMLIEIIAYLGDYLSYYQDAAATEAYLNTARSNISVKRHLRLLNYFLHQGINSRVWVQIIPADNLVEATTVEKGTLVLSSMNEQQTIIPTEQLIRTELLNQPIAAYELMHDIDCYSENNNLTIYTRNESNHILPKSSTTLAILGWCNTLKAGDVILLEETRNPQTGHHRDSDPNKRHIMRINKIVLQYDQGTPITRLDWHEEDALPFDFIITTKLPNKKIINCCSLSGNLALADQGLTVKYGDFIWDNSSEKIKIDGPPIVFCQHYDHQHAINSSAKQCVKQHAIYSLPALHLKSHYKYWLPQFDLLSSQQFSHDFVLEIENNNEKYLRFGDNDFGRKPQLGEKLIAIARCQTAYQERVNRDQLNHLVTNNNAIAKVRNPLPATVNKTLEDNEKARKTAPEFYQKIYTCFSADDYVEKLKEHSEIISASGQITRANQQSLVLLYVQRKDNQSIDDDFSQELLDYLEPYRYVSHQLTILEPHYIPLKLSLVVDAYPGYTNETVKHNLIQAFSTEHFFTTTRFQLGTPLYFSQIIEYAMGITGVSNIDITNKESQLTYLNRYSDKNALITNDLIAKSFEILGGNKQIKNQYNFLVQVHT